MRRRDQVFQVGDKVNSPFGNWHDGEITQVQTALDSRGKKLKLRSKIYHVLVDGITKLRFADELEGNNPNKLAIRISEPKIKKEPKLDIVLRRAKPIYRDYKSLQVEGLKLLEHGNTAKDISQILRVNVETVIRWKRLNEWHKAHPEERNLS